MNSKEYSLRWTNKGSVPYNPVFCILIIEQNEPLSYFHIDLANRTLLLKDSEYFREVKGELRITKGTIYPNSKPKDFGYELLRSTEPINPDILKEFFPELFI